MNRSPLGRKLHRIVDQLGDGLLDQFAIAVMPAVAPASSTASARCRSSASPSCRVGDIGEQRRRIEGREGGAARARFDLGDAQQRLETATMPSKSAVARSIGARSSGLVPRVQRRVLEPRAGTGDRGAQIVSDRVRYLRARPSIRRAMRSSMSLIVSAS